MKLLVTGGMGFIGSNFVRYWLENHKEDEILVLDADTYAAQGYLPGTDHSRLKTLICDIRDRAEVRAGIDDFQPDACFHLAAESHVCRSLAGPSAFVTTNIVGTFNMLEEWREYRDRRNRGTGPGFHLAAPDRLRFIHVSTDEVFGDLGLDPVFKEKLFEEETPYNPRSPYAASKAASDHLVAAYHHSYGLDTVVTNCTNNFGPNQHPEKLIPRTVLSMLHSEPVIIHGKGDHRRDWLSVLDHCRALETVFFKGESGQSYCIGGGNERSNLDVVRAIAQVVHKLTGLQQSTLTFTNDRPTDDERYAVDTTKIRALGWAPWAEFDNQLASTVAWYLEHAGVRK